MYEAHIVKQEGDDEGGGLCVLKYRIHNYANLVAAIIVLLILPPTVLTFTHCLKRRKENGLWSWKCRKATMEKRCLRRIPRSMVKHIER
jgi:hypothetical protein